MIIDSVDFFLRPFPSDTPTSSSLQEGVGSNKLPSGKTRFSSPEKCFYGFHVRYALPKLHRSRVKIDFLLSFGIQWDFFFPLYKFCFAFAPYPILNMLSS
jgi:hypothetical protein